MCNVAIWCELLRSFLGPARVWRSTCWPLCRGLAGPSTCTGRFIAEVPKQAAVVLRRRVASRIGGRDTGGVAQYGLQLLEKPPCSRQ